MAGRNKKVGLDWFALDVAMDTKVELLEAEFGLKGFAVFVKLLQRIYGENGYYCEWDEEVELLFSRRINEGRSFVSEVVRTAIRRGIFDEDKFKNYGILTSRGIQERFLNAVERRKQVDVKNEYLLVHNASDFKNANIIGINVNINTENVDGNKQSRVEESRGKESRVYMPDAKQVSTEQKDIIITLTLNDKTEYPVEKSKVLEWAELYPAVDVFGELRKMKGWLDANPTKRKTKRGIARFINGWLSREQDKGGNINAKKSNIQLIERDSSEIDKYDQLDQLDAEWLQKLYEV